MFRNISCLVRNIESAHARAIVVSTRKGGGLDMFSFLARYSIHCSWLFLAFASMILTCLRCVDGCLPVCPPCMLQLLAGLSKVHVEYIGSAGKKERYRILHQVRYRYSDASTKQRHFFDILELYSHVYSSSWFGTVLRHQRQVLIIEYSPRLGNVFSVSVSHFKRRSS